MRCHSYLLCIFVPNIDCCLQWNCKQSKRISVRIKNLKQLMAKNNFKEFLRITIINY